MFSIDLSNVLYPSCPFRAPSTTKRLYIFAFFTKNSFLKTAPKYQQKCKKISPNNNIMNMSGDRW